MNRAHDIWIYSLVATAVVAAEEPATLPQFALSREFREQTCWLHDTTGVRCYLNAPVLAADNPRVLVVFATPNGNSIEQTLGCRLDAAEGDAGSLPQSHSTEPAHRTRPDWHFDIQHVAAQLRMLRHREHRRDWILAVTDCAQRSWPSFRQSEPHANRKIRQQVQELNELVGADQFVLSGHSGGGSFIFGYIESVDSLPSSLQRIVLLDANYAYDDPLHADKLLVWLQGGRQRRLVVIAYDDREITLNGKKVLGPTGGTYRATQRMVDRFRQDMELKDEMEGPFRHLQGMNGQIQIYVHQNPENKILHTALVGEMNGLLHGLTVGDTPNPSGTRLSGPRAYRAWIQSSPEIDPVRHDINRFELPFQLAIPARPPDAISGSQLVARIADLPLEAREQVVLQELRAGNIPDRLRTLKAIHAFTLDRRGRKHAGTYFVTPDYVAVGSNQDFLRVPLTPQAASQVAMAWHGSLITPKVSDDIFAAAELRLTPQPMTEDREAVATFLAHQRLIQSQWNDALPNLLVAGIKKDVVLTRLLDPHANRVAIYGWHTPDGTPIQPIYVKHLDNYVDYSHGIRLMADFMWLDGLQVSVADVLQDQDLCGLLAYVRDR
jgi:hypothetical protein